MSTPRTDAWGIQQDWVDADDRPHRVADATVERLREVIGTPPPDLDERRPLVVRPGARVCAGPATVVCEDGSERAIDEVLPRGFPLGYHRLHQDGRDRLLVVSPGRCVVPEQQQWGWTVQLYGARSAASWGIGDLGDLRTLRTWTERLGGGFLLVNPLHGVAPTLPQETSPYLPATRRFRNPVYLRVEDVPGFSPDLLAGHEDELAALRAAPLVERDGSWSLKRQVLHALFRTVPPGEDFERWRVEQGRDLEEWAAWCVLAEEHGPDARSWPEGVRRADGPEVAALLRARGEDVTFHAWLQWLVDRQLREAADGLIVLQDLPIGVSGAGADAWAWRDVLAAGVTVGAPPDLLNSTGQDWGSPPFVPWRLQEAEYAPFIASVRSTIAGAGGLRIDHVMGLFRLWWIPEGGPPTAGAYVRYPADDLLDIVALESHRAGAVVVGEDLGTVEPGVREALADRGILSYRVLWFEDDEPAAWPREALATVTTHDLPTVAGLWTGSDVDDQLASTDMARAEVEQGREDLLARLHAGGVDADADVPAAVDAAYGRLAATPSVLRALALEDVVGEERRPNVPGTVDRDNWRIPLPVPVEDLVRDERGSWLAGLMAARVSGGSPGSS